MGTVVCRVFNFQIEENMSSAKTYLEFIAAKGIEVGSSEEDEFFHICGTVWTTFHPHTLTAVELEELYDGYVNGPLATIEAYEGEQTALIPNGMKLWCASHIKLALRWLLYSTQVGPGYRKVFLRFRDGGQRRVDVYHNGHIEPQGWQL
jgi:hypothetical protein